MIDNLYQNIDYDPFKKASTCSLINATEIKFIRHDDDTDSLYFLNLQDFQLKQVSLHVISDESPIRRLLLPDLCGRKSTLLLPDNQIFIFSDSFALGETYLIETNNSVRQLQSGKQTKDACLNYHKDYVYALGGTVPISSRFSLKENKWEDLTPTPQFFNFKNMTSVVFDDNILIATFNTEMIRYDINNNKYQQDISITLNGNTNKGFIEGINQVFLVEFNSNIYESNDTKNWNIVGTNDLGNVYVWSYRIRYQDNIYFIDSKYNLVEFNLDTKKLSTKKNLK